MLLVTTYDSSTSDSSCAGKEVGTYDIRVVVEGSSHTLLTWKGEQIGLNE